MSLAELQELSGNKNKKISKKDYEEFCKEFVFDKLRGKSYGEAFCLKFGFKDTILKNLTDESARFHIEKLGYIE